MSHLKHCMMIDRRVLGKRLHGLNHRLRQGKPIEKSLQDVAKKLAASQAIYQQRLSRVPNISYPEDLPVSAKRTDISHAIEHNQVVIVAGETGSGKTTQIPKICLQLGRGIAGLIGHTQPRRMAARSVATRIAQELASKVGEHVGYKVRFADKSQPHGYIKLMTDGILLAEIQSDARLEQYDTIIIDEAHERSLNIDFLLGYLKQLLPKRPDLKVIVTSATINTEHFSHFFNDAPVIEVSGRSYPVDILYHPMTGDDDAIEQDLPQAIVAAVDEVERMDAMGDVLVFLPGEREIREAMHALENHAMKHTEVIPLFSRLSASEQDRVFQSHRGRRIILATNVAETSLTVPGIRFVIDSGLVRMSRYSAKTKIQRLPIEPISQASAKQRSGRCGRVSSGVCIRLYDEDSFLQRSEQTDPEILRTNLASVILQMASLGLGDVAKFPLMNPPESRSISDGYRLLHELQAVDKQRKLTAIGRKLARLPIDPRLGRMVLQAQQEGSMHEVLVIVSALSVQDPRLRPMNAQQKADQQQRIFRDETSDFMSYVKLWDWYHEQAKLHSKNQLRKLCQKHYLSYIRLREWHDLHGQLWGMLRDLGLKPNQQPAKPDDIHRALLAGLLGHIAIQEDGKNYLGARNLKLSIFPGSGMYKKPPKWLMAANLMETNRLYARIIAPIDPLWLERLAAHIIKHDYSEPHWSSKRAQVLAYERLSLFGLTVVAQRIIHYGAIDKTVSRELFIRHALVLGEFRTFGKYAQHNQSLIKNLEKLEAKSRRRDVLAEEQVIFEFFDALIPDHVYSGKLFEQWRKDIETKQPKYLYLSHDVLLANRDVSIHASDFPDSVQIGAQCLRYEYHFDPSHHADGITLIIPQAMLGQLQAERFEWLVVGMLQEKLMALIKGLPKSLRRNFVPAPQFAEAAMDAMTFAEGNLLSSFSRQLERMTGIYISNEQWNLDTLPKHLKMNFRVLNERKKILQEHTDLKYLQQKFAHSEQVKIIPHALEKEAIKRWDFGDLPESVTQKLQGLQMQRFPALVDRQDSVAIVMFEQQHAADHAMYAGVRRLLMLAMYQQVKILQQQMKKNKAMMMHAALLGDAEILRQDVINKTFESVFLSGVLPRTQADFEACLEQGRSKLVQEGQRIMQWVDDALQAYAHVRASMQQSIAPQKAAMLADVQQQLDHLISVNFVAHTPVTWLAHVPRFLKAAAIRIEKSGRDLAKDKSLSEQVNHFWQNYEQRLKTGVNSDDLVRFRWMIEELRVSMFAQSLKTSIPISVKRLEKQWQNMR
ncbi:MAG: ATP-dependent RNA helicase HrpA [Mariprofundaceae bacterium]|nr:ATP-dependent RNA helicase HrpA [Mariprofundaceae bacterium]